MTFFSYPVDLLTWALLLWTLLAAITIARSKQIPRPDKYLALSLTFATAGTIGLIAWYSIALSAAVCLAATVLCSVKFYMAWREEKEVPLTSQGNLEITGYFEATLLSSSERRPLTDTRLINGGG